MFITTIQLEGKTVFFFDYTQCKTQEQMISGIRESAEYIRNQPDGVLSLSDFTGTFAGQEFMNEASRLNKEVFSSKIDKGAALGITGIKKILLDGYNLIAKAKIHPFKTKDEALKYLVSR